jgi:hypothetical protein
MAKISLAEAEETAKASRAKAEEEAQAAAYDGRKRRQRTSTKSVAIIIRCTPAKRAQLLAVADRLDTSIAQTVERAIDALERELNRKQRKQERAA